MPARWRIPRWLVAAGVALGLSGRPALAACDLSQLIGYTLVFGKTIDGYIQDGKRYSSFQGCTRDRVLVFQDDTGVRCKETFLQTADFPRAFLCARGPNDMKLCVEGYLYGVAQPD
ncbi:hypothetical protein [Rhodopila globiformis]|uniref:Uncharacterized protein n=1 Tax=Rhodopila globiformis TaxID=1071 RepID=A0A2S6NLM9_RHOGL|nr:hypothetical protein [Rhodopila globiformis]PPQ36241.1 hypothetical protein CCS01_05480 [Rhodopila globiformis]